MKKLLFVAVVLGASAWVAAQTVVRPVTPPTNQPAVSGGKVLAFPGAEGFGASTPGGRGGKVYVVTTLEDYDKGKPPIPGSFRAAIEAEGKRIIVFAVSGNIQLKQDIRIRNPYLTIAGQTAPGDGVCLACRELVIESRCHDVIIRYLRVRVGDVTPEESDSITGMGCSNVILDHCSASWSIDECVSFYNNQNVTIQWCLVAESLNASHHSKGRHGFGGIWGGDKSSFHHNLLAHHASRNPRFRKGLVDYRNNVIYNWGHNSAYGGEEAKVNIVANYYKAGPATREPVRNRIVEPEASGQWYVADNYVFGFPKITENNWDGGVQMPWKDPHRKVPPAPKPFPAAPVITQTAEQAYVQVLADVGANRPARDSLDARIVEEVRTGTAKFKQMAVNKKDWTASGNGIIDSQKDVGGWPELKSAPAPLDSDGDGMPDAWEKTHGLNPKNASDAAADRDGDGYTNIEEYINSLAGPTAI
jgi:pectate lyase